MIIRVCTFVCQEYILLWCKSIHFCICKVYTYTSPDGNRKIAVYSIVRYFVLWADKGPVIFSLWSLVSLLLICNDSFIGFAAFIYEWFGKSCRLFWWYKLRRTVRKGWLFLYLYSNCSYSEWFARLCRIPG